MLVPARIGLEETGLPSSASSENPRYPFLGTQATPMLLSS